MSVPTKIAGIDFHYDGLINTLLLAVVFMFCTFYLAHRQSENSKDTRIIIEENSRILQEDLTVRRKSDDVIQLRLFNIESRMSDHIAQMVQTQGQIAELQKELNSETKNRKSGKGTEK